MNRRSSLVFAAGAFLVSWTSILSAGEASAPAGDRLLARWKGGELRASILERRYGGRADLEGEQLENLICKASFREIYSAMGREKQIDLSPAYRDEEARLKERRLAETWLARRRGAVEAAIGEKELEAEWRRQSAPGGALYLEDMGDLEVLFLRCGLRPAERQTCRERAAAADRELEAGTPFISLATVEARVSGRGSGYFPDVSLGQLNLDLRAAASSLEPGGISPWIEQPHGLVRLRLVARRPRSAPRSAFEPALRSDLVDAGLSAEVEKARTKLALAKTASEREVAAAAALAEGVEAEEAFRRGLADQMSWWLSDQAFLSDREILPDDAELRLQLEAQRARFEEVELDLAVVAVTEQAAALARAGEVEEFLATAAGDAEARFGLLAGRFPSLRREHLAKVRFEQLGRKIPELAKPLQKLAAGEWRGPIPLATADPASALGLADPPTTQRGDYVALAFARLARRELPPLDEVRQELYRQARGRLGGSTQQCVQSLGKRWGFELLPEEKPAEQAAPDR